MDEEPTLLVKLFSFGLAFVILFFTVFLFTKLYLSFYGIY